MVRIGLAGKEVCGSSPQFSGAGTGKNKADSFGFNQFMDFIEKGLSEFHLSRTLHRDIEPNGLGFVLVPFRVFWHSSENSSGAADR